MGSTFMLCTVDQESGVHGILVWSTWHTSVHGWCTWHTSPNVYALLGSASSGHHTGNGFDRPAKLLSNPVALQGTPLKQRLVHRLELWLVSARACGHKTNATRKPHEDTKKSFGPQSPAALKWAGVAKNPRVQNS